MSETVNVVLFWVLFLAVIGIVVAVTVQMVNKKQQRVIKTRQRGRFTVIDGGKNFYKE